MNESAGKISIIIPTLNEADYVISCLKNLESLRTAGHEIIIVDGGSTDDTIELCAQRPVLLINSAPGRAIQLNRGALAATGNLLLFLHADTTLPKHVDSILSTIACADVIWGRFDIRLSGQHYLFKVIAFWMNLRSRLTGVATGDQAIFVSKKLFQQCGGFPELALMEDIALSKKLKHYRPPICLRDRVITSSRRWEKNGIVKTIVSMWLLRIRYFFGVNPVTLARDYE